MMTERVLAAFDFDGVICDSTRECLVVSWNTWMAFQGRTERRYDARAFTPEEVSRFSAWRGLCRRVNDYLVFYRQLDSDPTLPPQVLFDEWAGRETHEGLRYRDLFFHERKLLRTASEDVWLSLHSFYPGITDLLRELNDTNQLAIVTLKDSRSVDFLLRSQGITLPARRIFGEEKISLKTEALAALAKDASLERKQLLLVDDSIQHLLEPARLGYTCLLATWGYLTPEQLRTATVPGIRAIRLAEVSTAVRQWLACAAGVEDGTN